LFFGEKNRADQSYLRRLWGFAYDSRHLGRQTGQMPQVCGQAIEIPAASSEEEIFDADPSPFDGLSEKEMTAGEVSQDQRHPCPACGEMIVLGAVKCHFCGEIFDETLKKQEQKKQKKEIVAAEGGDLSTTEWIIAILCSGIGCIAGTVWMIQGKPKGKKMLMVSLCVQGFWVVVRFLIASLNQGVGP